MMAQPKLWMGALSERHAKLGALVVREGILVRELADVRRQAEALQGEIISLERTGSLAEQVADEAASTNGHAEPALPP